MFGIIRHLIVAQCARLDSKIIGGVASINNFKIESKDECIVNREFLTNYA